MNVALWIVQSLLAIVFGMAGAMKILTPQEKLPDNLESVKSLPAGFVKFTGTVELMAMAGLLLPGITKTLPILTPIAAVGLVLVMIGAIIAHLPRKEYQSVAMNVMLLLMASFVAFGRFMVEPL